MFNGNASLSLADIAAVTGNGRNNDGMWGGDGWWAIIIFAMIFGWGGFGGNGWGGNGGMGATASHTPTLQFSVDLTRRLSSGS